MLARLRARESRGLPGLASVCPPKFIVMPRLLSMTLSANQNDPPASMRTLLSRKYMAGLQAQTLENHSSCLGDPPSQNNFLPESLSARNSNRPDSSAEYKFLSALHRSHKADRHAIRSFPLATRSHA